MKRKIFFIFGLLLLCCNNIKAGMLLMRYQHDTEKFVLQRNAHLNRHFIVAIDGAMPKYTYELFKTSTKDYVEKKGGPLIQMRGTPELEDGQGNI